jgi:plasmid stabilization system protein ParE
MSCFIVSPSARDELDAIWNYIGIENVSPQAADRLLEMMFEKFALLGVEPKIGEPSQEFNHLVPGLGQFSAGNYMIYYTPTDSGVRIGHVAHGR